MKQWLKYGVLVPLFAVSTVSAQNNTSAYSIIGIGDIEKGSFDRTTGMGYAGVALSSNRYMYHANPASYSRLDEHFFDIEISTRYKGVNYSGIPISDPTQSRSSDIQFKKIAMAVKPWRHWAISVGLVPFSTSNYSFYGVKSVLGSPIQPKAYYEGSGSTNQFYLANSYEINKNFSIGFQASYLFGQLQEKETLSSSDVTDSILLTTRNIYLGNLYYKIGAQYQGKITKNWQVALGATASPQTRLRADYSLYVQNGASVLMNQEFYRSNYFSIPKMYTGGLAAIYKDKYTFAADYHYEDWATLNYKGISYALVNSNRYSVGAEYSKKLSYLNQSYEKYFLQAGMFYNNSYLRILGTQLTDYGFTLGAGVVLPINALSGFGIQGAMELGQRGTTDNGLVKEKYTQFTITLSYRDLWLSRKLKRYN